MRSSAGRAASLTLAFTTHEPSALPTLASIYCCMRAGARNGARNRDRLAGRAAARLAISRALGISDVGRIVLRARPGRPPAVFPVGARGALHELPVALSITHSAGRAVAAAARPSTRVGVDLERCRTVRSRQLRYFLTSTERRDGARHSPTTLWVLKEAAWKALGCDGRTPFSAVALCFDPSGRLTAVSHDGRTIDVRAALFHPWPGFICAVVSAEEQK